MSNSAKQWNMLGKGIYTRGEAARLLRVDLRKLNRWVHGYRYTSSGGRSGDVPALLKPELPEVGGVDAISFRDLIELLFVVGFREEGLTLQYIRRAADVASERYGTNHPFSLKRFGTDGRQIFATLESLEDSDEAHEDKRHVEEIVSGQLVFKRVIERYLRQLEYNLETGETIRWWPMGRSRKIAVDPSRNFGAPVESTTGVPTEAMFRAYVAEGEDADAVVAVADWFKVPPASVRDSVEFERQLANVA